MIKTRFLQLFQMIFHHLTTKTRSSHETLIFPITMNNNLIKNTMTSSNGLIFQRHLINCIAMLADILQLQSKWENPMLSYLTATTISITINIINTKKVLIIKQLLKPENLSTLKHNSKKGASKVEEENEYFSQVKFYFKFQTIILYKTLQKMIIMK